MNASHVEDELGAGSRRRARSPRGQGDQLRAEILLAVARLLDEQVHAPDLNLSLREVARETGIATPSMYIHFASKEALGWAVAADGYERLVTAMRAADSETPGSAADRLRAQAHVFLRFAEGNRGVFRLMFGHDVGRMAPDKSAHPGSLLARQWIDAVHACEAEGHVWPEGAEQVVRHLWSALLGRFALWATTFEYEEAQDSPALFADYLLDRILSR